MPVEPRTVQRVPKRIPARPLTRGGLAPAERFTSKPLTPDTWPAFARLVEKHNGIFGGCWCISFHLGPGEGKRGAAAA
jgi:hypothetical protein